MKLYEYKNRFKKYIDYSNIVYITVDKLLPLFKNIKLDEDYKINKIYASLFSFISKIYEDEIYPIQYVSKVSGLKNLFEYELLILDFYLKNLSKINPLIYSVNGFETKLSGGVGGPETFLKLPPTD